MKSYNVKEIDFGKTGFAMKPDWMKGQIFEYMGDRVKMKQDLMRLSHQGTTWRDSLMQIPLEEISQMKDSKTR